MADETETPQEDGEARPPAKGPKGALLIGGLVGGLVIGATAGLLVLGPKLARRSGIPAAVELKTAEPEEGGKGGEGKVAVAAPVHLIDNIILNPAGSNGSRFLMLQTALELKDATLEEELKARDAEIRDLVLRLMGRKTVEELTNTANREGFKQELIDSLGILLRKKGAVRRIYFPQFVIQ